MLDLSEINSAIEELENTITTYDTCIKLSALYNVKNHMLTDTVEQELDDILPQYKKYCNIKRKYQLNELSKDNIIYAMENVCKEIEEFIQVLYSNTDTNEERNLIKKMIEKLKITCNQ